MSPIVFFRNFVVFAVFVLVIFVTPFVFASGTVSNSLELTSQVRGGIHYYQKNNPSAAHKSTLRGGTVIQFPTQVMKLVKVDPAAGIDFKELMRAWIKYQGQDPDGDGKNVPRILGTPRANKIPVRILSTPDGAVSKGNNISYLNFHVLLNNPNYYQAHKPQPKVENTLPFAGVTTPQAEAVESASEPSLPFSSDPSAGSEATRVKGSASERPDSQETQIQPSDLSRTARERQEMAKTMDELLKEAERQIKAQEARPQTPRQTGKPHHNKKCEDLRTQVAAALGESQHFSSRVNCYLDLFHKETSCRPHLFQPSKANGGKTPNDGYGLCTLEATKSVRAWRGPECNDISTVRNQTICCAHIMKNWGREYFEPVKMGRMRKCD